VSWDSCFTEPIELQGGVKLASLREAIVHLVKAIPTSERTMPEVLTAAEFLTNAAEHGGSIEFRASVRCRRSIGRLNACLIRRGRIITGDAAS
jgi:hypothetical protein